MQITTELEAKGVSLRILNFGVDTGTPTGKLILTVLGGIAQFEREIMLERQREGIGKAKAVLRRSAPPASCYGDRTIFFIMRATGPGRRSATPQMPFERIYLGAGRLCSLQPGRHLPQRTAVSIRR